MNRVERDELIEENLRWRARFEIQQAQNSQAMQLVRALEREIAGLKERAEKWERTANLWQQIHVEAIERLRIADELLAAVKVDDLP